MTKYKYNEKETAAWLNNLPKKSVAVKCLIRSKDSKVLLVKPNYKPGWQFPGGGVEVGESPVLGMARELHEELGVSVRPENIRLIDCVFRSQHDAIILMYEYIGNIEEAGDLVIQEAELEQYKYETLEAASLQVGEYYKEFLKTYAAH